MTQTRACSEATNEPLPGTAKAGSVFIAMEHHYGWSHDVLDGGVFGEELSAQFKEYIARYGAKFQLIRQPGRFGQMGCDGISVFISRGLPGQESLVRLKLQRPEELLDIDLDADTIPGAEPVNHPLVLVCTHGKRDVCCAVKGRPLASTLWVNFRDFDGDLVWESSHLKGHRFAPVMLVLPWNLNYGRTHAIGAIHAVNEILAGRVATEAYRGRGIYKAWAQSAEVAVRELIDGLAGPDDVLVLEDEVADDGKTARVVVEYAPAAGVAADGAELAAGAGVGDGAELAAGAGAGAAAGAAARKWNVQLALEPIGEVISSCGDAPKEGFSWIVQDIAEVTSPN